MTALVKYEAARRALVEAKTVDEAKDIRDKAEAMRAYAHQAKNRQLEVDAAEIRMRAERRLGELIVAQKETVGLNTGTAGKGRPSLCGANNEPPKDTRPTLKAAGIDRKLSSRAQKPFSRLAPILTSFSRSVVNDQCSTSFGKASVRMKLARL